MRIKDGQGQIFVQYHRNNDGQIHRTLRYKLTIVSARFFVWCCKVKGKIMSWINFKRILKRNFEIDAAGHQKIGIEKMDPFVPLPVGTFSLLVF